MDLTDKRALSKYLQSNELIRPGEPIKVAELSGGVSCQTLRISRLSGGDLVIKKALRKLKVKEEWLSSPDRIHIEAGAMRVLRELTPPGSVPGLLFEDRRHHLIIMEAVREPHFNWKQQLLEGGVDLDLVRQFGQLLAAIHSRSFHQSEYAEAFADRQFFENLRIAPYYQFTASRIPAAVDFFEDLITDTRQNLHCLVHGDYSPKNVLIYQNRVILLDHEVLHYGDGTFDLGFALTHFLSKARHVKGKNREFREAAGVFWEAYRTQFPLPAAWETRAVRQTVGCMLARVKGKSPLEYFSRQEREEQEDWGLAQISALPEKIPDLINTI